MQAVLDVLTFSLSSEEPLASRLVLDGAPSPGQGKDIADPPGAPNVGNEGTAGGELCGGVILLDLALLFGKVASGQRQADGKSQTQGVNTRQHGGS